MCLSEALCGIRTDKFARTRDRMSGVSRGHSGWIANRRFVTGEGLKALRAKAEANMLNRAAVPSKARTVPGDKPGKWCAIRIENS